MARDLRVKVKEWRGVWGGFGLGGAPVLEVERGFRSACGSPPRRLPHAGGSTTCKVVGACIPVEMRIQVPRRGNNVTSLQSDAGGSPAATHFSCFAKKSKQKKATRGSSPPQKRGGSLRYSKRQAAAELGLVEASSKRFESALALRQSSRTAPVVSALLGSSHRDPVDYSPLSPRI